MEKPDQIMITCVCQINHMNALLAIRRNDIEGAERMLKDVLKSGYDNVESLWVRLLLANLLRRRGQAAAASSLFFLF